MLMLLSVFILFLFSPCLLGQVDVDEDPIGICWGESAIYYTQNSADQDYYSTLTGMDVTRHKMYIHWKDCDTVKGNEPGVSPPNEYNWSKLDEWLDTLPDNGTSQAQLTVFTVGTEFYDGLNSSTLIFSGKGNPIASGYEDEYQDFITALVLHCGKKVKYYNRDTESFLAGNNVLSHWPYSATYWGDEYDRDFFVEEWVETQQLFWDGVEDARNDESFPDNWSVYVIGIEQDGTFVGSAGSLEPFNDDAWDSTTGIFSIDDNNNGIPDVQGMWDLISIRNYRDPFQYPEKIEWFEDQFSSPGAVPDWVCTEGGGPIGAGWLSHWRSYKGTTTYDYVNGSSYGYSWMDSNWSTFTAQLAADRASTAYYRIYPRISILLGEATSAEDDTRDDIQGMDFARRHMIMMNAGCKWFIHWSLYAEWDIGSHEWPHQSFGKLRHFNDPSFNANEEEPCHVAFELYIDTFQDMETIEKIAISGESDVHHYKCEFNGSYKYCSFLETDDTYVGETARSIDLTVPVGWSNAIVTKWDGSSALYSVTSGVITVSLDHEPIYIEEG